MALAFIVTVQAPVPVQAPAHPENAELAPGAGVRVTCAPDAKLASQVVPQLIPDGLLVTTPVPVPDCAIVRA